MTLRGMVALILATGCGGSEGLHGQVVDIWGNPVPEATVVVEGESERPTTDAQGNFTLPLKEGKQRIKAGREGYIQEHVEIEVVPGAEPPTPILRLYPKPSEPGFYVVGQGEYTRLEPQRVHTYGSDLRTVTGIKSVETRVEADPVEVVFHTDLRMDEIMRLGLELHKLEYLKTTELPGALGQGEVTVNLWTSQGEVDVDVAPMRSRNDYRLTPKEPVEPGWYAFTTQELLDPEEGDDLSRVPKELQVAFPFELR